MKTEDSWILQITLGFLSALFGIAFGAKIMVQKCKSNDDCSEGYQCENEICQKCLNCEIIFRKGKTCVTNFNQCGKCLDGYEGPMVTDYSTIIKPCTAIKISQEEKCWSDKMCALSSYCHQGSCVKCFNCSLYNRLTPLSGCAKELYECGSCLNGHYEVPVTTEWNTKPCKSTTLEISNATSLPTIIVPNTYIPPLCLFSFAFALLGVVIVFVILMRRKKKSHIPLQNSECNTPESMLSPPAYSSIPFTDTLSSFPHPSAPTLADFDSSQSHKLLEIKDEIEGKCPSEFESEELQTARIFKLPSASYYYNSSEETDRLNNEAGEEDSDQGSSNSDNSRCFEENFGAQTEGASTQAINHQNLNNIPVSEIPIDEVDAVGAVNSVNIIDIVVLDSSDTHRSEDNSAERE